MEDKNLVESIGKIADHLAAVAPKKQVSHHEYMAARRKRNKLERRVFMSGARLSEKQLTEEQIALLNKVKGGKYLDGRIVVLERSAAGMEGGAIDILPRNQRLEDRMAMMAEAPNLTVLLQTILAEQEANENRPTRGRR